MPKTTSTNNALTLITQKLTAEQKLKDMVPPDLEGEEPRAPTQPIARI